MKNSILTISFVLFTGTSVFGQILQQYTLWNQNHYLINPAAAGNQDHTDVAIGFRQQWAGVSNAPRSYYATGHTVLNRPKSFQRSALYTSKTARPPRQLRGRRSYVKHALGGALNSGENGAFKKTQAMLTYALHLPIKNGLYLSFGLSGGLSNFGFNESEATVLSNNDPTYNSYAESSNTNLFNADAGTYLYSDKFFVGYSGRQILRNQLKLANVTTGNDPTSLEMEHLISGGYHFDLSNDFRLTPNMLIKKTGNLPTSFEVNGTLMYKEVMNIGLTYRNESALAAIFGFQFNHLFKAGYSFDYTLTEIRERSSGSHEIFIGLTLF
ncbi:MAG: type IX secretion system PorP/SprF family membrane protein [Vicingaceae bacterium]|jgi:type IX secretion system PorP/SprF family membrane protein